MSVTITSVLFTDEYSGSPSGHGADTGLNHLKGVVGDLMWVTIQGYVSWSTTDTPMSFSVAAQTITRQDCTGGGSFIDDGFNIGDTITVTGTGGADDTNYTVTDVSQYVLTVSGGITVTAAYASVNVYGTRSIVGGWVDMFANVVPNDYDDTHFNSLTDVNSVQRYSGTVPAISSSNSLPPNARSWAWWDGYDQTAGYYYYSNALQPTFTTNSITGYKQYFTVVYAFFIKPFYTADQLQLMKDAFTNSVYQNSGSPIVNTSNNGFTVPITFQDGGSWKFIAQLDFRFASNDKAPQHTSEGYEWANGNVAWFNDAFPISQNNADRTLFVLDSTTYVDTLTSATVDTCDYNKETTVTVKINDTGFTNGDRFVVNFMWLPTNAKVYQNYQNKANPATFRTVFVHDRCSTTINAASKNGDQYGSGYQVITSCTGTVGGGYLTIVFHINMGSLAKQLFDSVSDTDWNYFIWVTPQYKAETTLALSTRNAVMCDVNLADTDTDNAALLVIDTDGSGDEYFYRYPDVNVNPVTNYAGLVGDIAYSKIGFKTNGKLLKIGTRFDALIYDGGMNLVDQFTLKNWETDVKTTWNGVYNEISISENNGFNLADGDIRNTISISRDNTLDGGGYYGFQFIYGFQLGFQYWQLLTNYAPEVESYSTQYWSIYTQGGTAGGTTLPSGYTTALKKITTWSILDTSTDVVTDFEFYSDVSTNDMYDGTLPTIAFTIQDSNSQSTKGIVPADTSCIVTLDCLGNGVNIGVPPAPYSSIIAVLGLFYDNGTQVFDTSSTEESLLSTSLWTSQPTVTVLSNTHVTISATLDMSLSETPITTYRMVCKLGYKI